MITLASHAEHTHVPIRAILIRSLFDLLLATFDNFCSQWHSVEVSRPIVQQDDAKFKKHELHKTSTNSLDINTWSMLTKFDIERFIVLSPPCVKVGRELLAIAPYCDFCLTHIYLDLSVLFGSLAYHMDAQRLKLAQSMLRSTVQAFLTKFGISGREEGGWQ